MIIIRVPTPNDKLRRLRRSRTLTQAQMANLLGINQATWCKYERGTLEPPFDMKAHIAAILGTSAADLFTPEVAA